MSNAAPRQVLARWQAVLVLVIGGGMAQVAGVVIALIAAGILVAKGDGGLEEVGRSFMVIAGGAMGVGLTLLLVSIVTPLVFGVPIRSALGLRSPPLLATIATMVGVLGLGPTSELFVEGMKRIAPDLTFNTLGMLEAILMTTPVWLLWPVLALSPGIAEELFFRGAVQRAFGRGVVAITVSAVTFSMFHLDPHHVIGVLPIGFYLAWVAARTDSTWVTVVAHVLNNTASITASKLLAEDPASKDEPTAWWVVALGLLVAMATVVAITRLTRPRESPLLPG
jgi:membrane protease YdiL (CAAX protease family)